MFIKKTQKKEIFLTDLKMKEEKTRITSISVYFINQKIDNRTPKFLTGIQAVMPA